MKKLLLTLSLVASFASVSAFPGQAQLAAAYAACTKANAQALPGKAFNQATKTRPRRFVSTFVVSYVIIEAGKKAYDRYKARKKNRKNAQVEVTENA